MHTLAPGVAYLDLDFLNVPRVIATGVLHDVGGVALVDPGPSTTLGTLTTRLEATGIQLKDVTTILLTHIHLDHAGVTGSLVRTFPHMRVFVHEVGAPHLVDPSKLLSSAARLYEGDMDRLWGEVLPVPATALTVLRGGERITAGGRALEVAYTPGHASHHVSYFSADTGLAFVGDTAGVRLAPREYILPPTPPPDIDLDVWDRSLALYESWRPETLFLTHFGPSGPVGAHLAELRAQLTLMADVVRQSLRRDGTDEDRERWAIEQMRVELTRRLGIDEARTYEAAARLDLSYRGLTRYWKKRAA
jgi:glyoxylase-like metal-dependent hydrolase (beta-lactamase superfamily II)